MLQRIFKWCLISLGGLLGLLLLASAVIWIKAGRLLDRVHELPETTFRFDPATADVEEGRRAALLRGCFSGCHGDEAEGAVWFNDTLMGVLVAPDLTRAFREMSDANLDRLVRHGVHPDGRSAVLMPSSMFHHLSDADLNNIMAFLRSLPASDGPARKAHLGLMARFYLSHFDYLPEAQRIRENAPWMSPSASEGEYLARTVCTECHGPDLEGAKGGGPDLVITLAYSPEQFRALMREGIAVGGSELGLMAEVARGRFSHFTDAEIDALHAWLLERAGGG